MSFKMYEKLLCVFFLIFNTIGIHRYRLMNNLRAQKVFHAQNMQEYITEKKLYLWFFL